MKYQSLFSGKNKTNIVSLLSVEFAHSVLSVKPVLLVQNLTLNSDTTPNYKHTFSLHRGPLFHQLNITLKHVKKQSKGLYGNLKPEHKKTTVLFSLKNNKIKFRMSSATILLSILDVNPL